MVTRVGVVLLLMACWARAAAPAELDPTTDAINQAIDGEMQVDAMGGDKEATEAFADLNPYLAKSEGGSGDKDMDPWESKTLSAIRGMSEAHMALNTVSTDEINFARDAEEAKDVIDQTEQMAQIKEKQDKASAANSITKQLADAQKSLTAAADTTEGLNHITSTTEFLDVGTDHSLDGPVDGGVFYGGETFKEWDNNRISFIEQSESIDEDYDSALMDGTAADVEQQITEAITNDASTAMSEASKKQQATEDPAMDEFAQDAESAQAAIQDMKATLAKPSAEDTKLNQQEVQAAKAEATDESTNDIRLGDAQEQHHIAQSKLQASDDIAAELAAAQASLNEAQAPSK
jgi:hypothetical protein